MHDAKVQHQQYPWASRLFLSPPEHERYRALCERLGLPADRITQEHRNSREWQIGVAVVVGWPLLTELLESAGEFEVIVSQGGKAADPRPDGEPQPWQAEFDEAGSSDPAEAVRKANEEVRRRTGMTPDVMSEGEAKILEAHAELQAERERWVDEAVKEAHAEVEEALDRFRADQQEGLEVLGRADADRLRRENEELRAEIRRLKTERAKNLGAYPDRDDDAILARFDFYSVDVYRRLRMDTVRSRFRGLAAFLLAFTPDGRYRNLALTKLEEAMFFANKGIAMEGR